MVPLDLRQFGAFEEQRLRAHVTAPILLRLPLHRRAFRDVDIPWVASAHRFLNRAAINPSI